MNIFCCYLLLCVVICCYYVIVIVFHIVICYCDLLLFSVCLSVRHSLCVSYLYVWYLCVWICVSLCVNHYASVNWFVEICCYLLIFVDMNLIHQCEPAAMDRSNASCQVSYYHWWENTTSVWCTLIRAIVITGSGTWTFCCYLLLCDVICCYYVIVIVFHIVICYCDLLLFSVCLSVRHSLCVSYLYVWYLCVWICVSLCVNHYASVNWFVEICCYLLIFVDMNLIHQCEPAAMDRSNASCQVSYYHWWENTTSVWCTLIRAIVITGSGTWTYFVVICYYVLLFVAIMLLAETPKAELLMRYFVSFFFVDITETWRHAWLRTCGRCSHHRHSCRLL